MRKTLKLLIFSCVCLSMAGAGTMNSEAAMNLETDAMFWKKELIH